MALQKTIYTADNTGVAAVYWCACDVDIDFHNRHGAIELMGYISKQAYDDGRSPVMVKSYEVRNDLFDAYFSEQVLNQENVNTRSQSYKYVKERSEEFSDAVEV